MQRRELLGILAGCAVWPNSAQAQHSTMPIVGFLGTGSAFFVWQWLRANRISQRCGSLHSHVDKRLAPITVFFTKSRAISTTREK
jgi:hypothetical protein